MAAAFSLVPLRGVLSRLIATLGLAKVAKALGVVRCGEVTASPTTLTQ